MAVLIIDTGVANRHSIRNALEFIGCDVEVSADPERIRNAGKLVFPGVGAFQSGMRSLRSRNLIDVLRVQVLEHGKPILGICLGMQMMAEVSQEDGEHEGLGWISGRVRRLEPAGADLKVPHIGFNSVVWNEGSRLSAGLPQPADFYFVHSYYLDTAPELVSGTVDYGGPFAVAIERDNIMGVQFHPEKSQAAGLHLLRNFVDLE
jgi:glutamine amidotransferase